MELKANLDKRLTTKDLEAGSFTDEASQGVSTAAASSVNRGAPRYWKVKVDQNLDKRICIDWYGTLQIDRAVPGRNIEALRNLQQAGYTLILCSFCGKAREDQVRALCQEWSKAVGCSLHDKSFAGHHLAKVVRPGQLSHRLVG